MRRYQLTILLLLTMVLCSCSASLRDGYEQLQIEMTAAEVESLVGKPHQVDSTSTIWLYVDENDKVVFSLKMKYDTQSQTIRLKTIDPWRENQ